MGLPSEKRELAEQAIMSIRGKDYEKEDSVSYLLINPGLLSSRLSPR